VVTSTHEVSHRIFAEHPEVAPVYEALGDWSRRRRSDEDTLAYWFETMEIALANSTTPMASSCACEFRYGAR
jgi:hypothetical protein